MILSECEIWTLSTRTVDAFEMCPYRRTLEISRYHGLTNEYILRRITGGNATIATTNAVIVLLKLTIEGYTLYKECKTVWRKTKNDGIYIYIYIQIIKNTALIRPFDDIILRIL